MRGVLPLMVLSFAALAADQNAQDERRLVSPDGQTEFRIFIADQSDTSLSRIAYQVWQDGKCVVGTSLMGLDIWEQEPLLGENEGLLDSKAEEHPEYNSLVVRYMQNGSTGRALSVEARAFNGRVEFRYLIPRSNMLEHVYLSDETTEFNVKDERVKVSEQPQSGFPAMHVVKEEDGMLRARLQRDPRNPRVASEAETPFGMPWRMIQTVLR